MNPQKSGLFSKDEYTAVAAGAGDVPSTFAEPLLADVEAVDGSSLAPLLCSKPPPALLSLLTIPPQMIVAETSAAAAATATGVTSSSSLSSSCENGRQGDDDTIALRHPSKLLEGQHSICNVEQLSYYADIYQLVSQRKLVRLCHPPSSSADTHFTYEFRCIQPNCPFRLKFRRQKDPIVGVNVKHLQAEACEGNESSACNHTCQPVAHWNAGSNEEENANIAKATSSTTEIDQVKTDTAYCASIPLLNALIAMHWLRQRSGHQGQKINNHRGQNHDNDDVNAALELFEALYGLRTSRERYERGNDLYECVAHAYPKTEDEDVEICSSTFGLWGLGVDTKTLPNSFLRVLVPTQRPPLRDPLEHALLRYGRIALRKTVFCCKAFAAIVLLFITFLPILYLVGGSLLVAGVLWGASWYNATAEIYRRSGVPVMGYVSDRTSQNAVDVRYLGNDGGHYGRTFVSQFDDGDEGLITTLYVPMIQLPHVPGSGFPSELLASCPRHGVCKQAWIFLLGVVYAGLPLSQLVGLSNIAESRTALLVSMGFCSLQGLALYVAASNRPPLYFCLDEDDLWKAKLSLWDRVKFVLQLCVYHSWIPTSGIQTVVTTTTNNTSEDATIRSNNNEGHEGSEMPVMLQLRAPPARV